MVLGRISGFSGAGATDILNAIGLGEAEIAIETVTDIVPVQQHGLVTGGILSRRDTGSSCSDF